MHIIIIVFNKTKPSISIIIQAKHLKNKTFRTEVRVGSNLMDAINNAALRDIEIFGVCDKQLSCHSCAVNIKSKKDKLKPISLDEEDVLADLGNNDKNNETRMSCQIILTEEMDGMIVEVNEAAFMSGSLSGKNSDDEDKI